MKLFLSLTLLLITLTPATSFADRLSLFPNDGSGDNFSFVTVMNGHKLILSGGTDPYFLSASGYQPGSTLGGGALFLYSAVIWVGGTAGEFSFPGAGSISMNPFITLPTDGRDVFRVPLVISFSHTGINFETGETIGVGGGAKGSITFYRGADGLYYASRFEQAPEPGTLALIGTGLMGVAAVARKRLRTSEIVFPGF